MNIFIQGTIGKDGRKTKALFLFFIPNTTTQNISMTSGDQNVGTEVFTPPTNSEVLLLGPPTGHF
jgi:hypothetical protein